MNAPTRSADAHDWPSALPGEEELAAHWGRDCFTATGTGAAGLFTLRDVHEVLCDSRTTSEYVALSTKEHRKVDAVEYTMRDETVVERVSKRVIGRLDLDRVEDFLADGSSLVLYRVHEFHPAIRRICRLLQSRTGRLAEAVAFLSPPGRGALPLHQDDVDVIVLQTSGTKRWRIFDPFDAQKGAGLVTVPEGVRPAHRLTLTPGNTCYMPAGRPHQALSCDDWSLHISITAWPVQPAQVLARNLGRVLSDLPKADLYTRWDGGFADRSALEHAADAAARAMKEAPQEWRLPPVEAHATEDRIAGILGIA
ncbi:cupin superfamily protein [Nocardiopsis sp. Huas11]|uniref:JmjC domain-containing protein n=1 Tax=Nocardiopsis sp. Huas11 TaxID=2183912 RepID=UPI000EB37A2E|nr:cupin domain-containing protein [Nocardiopsis sp. Huas11]RKS09266.1 cupin superfamily protein [Nocardiopsis sp. Huas11]